MCSSDLDPNLDLIQEFRPDPIPINLDILLGNQPNMANMNAAGMRKLLTDMLGPLGPPIDADGALLDDTPALPSLMDRLTTMKKRADVTKPPGPDVFRGTQEENARLWQTKMQDYLAHCGYPDDIAQLRVIKMFLADRALVWYLDLPNNADNPLTTEAFWTAFEGQYSGPGTQYAVEQSLMARKQNPGEDADAYITDVVTKANRLGWDQNRTMQHLIAGLNNQLKPLVMMKSPANLQEACRVIGTAKEAAKAQSAELDGVQTALRDLLTQMKLDKEDKKVTTVQPFQPRWHPPQSSPARPFSPQRPARRPFNGFVRPVFPIHIHQERMTRTQTTPPPQGRYQRMTQTYQGQPRCHACNAVGHFRASCPKRSSLVCTRCHRQGHSRIMCQFNAGQAFSGFARPGRPRPNFVRRQGN